MSQRWRDRYPHRIKVCMAERSKAFDSSSNLGTDVGSNPTAHIDSYEL